MYYLRTRPAANAIQFTVDQTVVQKVKEKRQAGAEMTKEEKEYEEAALACSMQNREACVMCSAWPGHMTWKHHDHTPSSF